MTTNDEFVNLIQDDADAGVVEAMRGLRPRYPLKTFEEEAELLEKLAAGSTKDPTRRDGLLRRAADLRAHKVTPVLVTTIQQPAMKKPALVRY